MSNKERFSWRAGLQNNLQTYLTAEDFGSDLNCCGKGLTRKQVWTIELNKDETVFMRSHGGQYITTDKYGMVKCEVKERTTEGKFRVIFSPFGSGRWAFKSEMFDTFLTGTGNKVICLSRNITEEELWFVKMAMHPQIALGNKRRKRYFKLENDEIRCFNIIPWGSNSILTLEYYLGKYLIKTPDNRFLLKDGTLTNSREKEAQYTLELRVNQQSQLEGVAFRDDEGKYLSGVGTSAILKSRNKKVSDDEIFCLDESPPQIEFETTNGSLVSVQAGSELWASSKTTTDKEVFQMEFNKSFSKWYLLTSSMTYWVLNENNGISTTSDQKMSNCLFKLEWEGGAVHILAANGKYLTIRPNGQLVAKSSSAGPNETFYIRLVNRPLLVLKSEFGFLGKKKAIKTEPEYMCNKSDGEIMELKYHEKGQYFIKGDNSKFWSMSDTAIVAKSKQPEPFVIQILGHCKMAILAPNKKFINAEKVGILRATMEQIRQSCHFEF